MLLSQVQSQTERVLCSLLALIACLSASGSGRALDLVATSLDGVTETRGDAAQSIADTLASSTDSVADSVRHATDSGSDRLSDAT